MNSEEILKKIEENEEIREALEDLWSYKKSVNVGDLTIELVNEEITDYDEGNLTTMKVYKINDFLFLRYIRSNSWCYWDGDNEFILFPAREVMRKSYEAIAESED